MNEPNPYQVLNVKEDASFEDIKCEYRKALLIFHPDKQNSTGSLETIDKFQQIQQAWQVLSDSNSRRQYDLKRYQRLLKGMHAEEVEFAEFDRIEDVWCRPCRCGDQYNVSRFVHNDYFLMYCLLYRSVKVKLMQLKKIEVVLIWRVGWQS